jgi:hypothetical protein
MPLGDRPLAEGEVIELPAGRASRGRLAVGEPGAIVLLSPLEGRRYSVVRIVRFDAPGG